MPTIRDTRLEDVLGCLESWKPYSPTDSAEIFIAAIGFEERASACFVQWCKSRKRLGGRVLLVQYVINLDDNAVQQTRFTLAAAEAGIQIVLIRYDHLSLYGEAIHFLSKTDKCSGILFDLSAMASFVFYPLMCAVANAAPSVRLEVCYAEATDYFPQESEWKAFNQKFKELDLVERARLFDDHTFQSHGVETVFESPNFPGRNENQPTTLVVIPNFSVERVRRMLSYASDTYSVNREASEWIIGIPPNREKNGWRHEALLELFENPSRKHDVCTFDFKEIILTLQQIWEANNESGSMVVAGLGSKAQHLGVFMFLKMHPDVGLILSEPKQFKASQYSSGVGKAWQLSIGRTDHLMEELQAWNKIVFSW